MNSTKFVCPHSAPVLNTLHGRSVAVRIANATGIRDAARDVALSGNELICVIVESDLPVDDIPFSEDWKEIPIHLRCPSMGRFGNLVRHLDLIRQLKLTIYLPCTTDNLTSLRILASVGIPCGVMFGDGEPDWESLADLMTYALLERTPHAPVEPFAFIADHYDPARYSEWGTVYFDDPRQFLHLGTTGRVAASPDDLHAGRFLADAVTELETTVKPDVITAKRNEWRRRFLEVHPCSVCEGWRVCRGKFASAGSPSAGCSMFFAELMDVVEQLQLRKAASN